MGGLQEEIDKATSSIACPIPHEPGRLLEYAVNNCALLLGRSLHVSNCLIYHIILWTRDGKNKVDMGGKYAGFICNSGQQSLGTPLFVLRNIPL